MITKYLVRGASVAVLGLGLFVAGGCSTDITGQSVRANPSPEMESIAYTHEQRQNNLMRVNDTNWRQLVDDWDRLWLMDQPLHLNNIPIP